MKTPLKRKAFLITLMVLAFAMTCGISFAADGKISVGVKAQYGQTEARSMLDMINDFRTGSDAWAWNETDTEKVTYQNLKTLTYDYGLEKVAMQRAAEIALEFAHERPNGENCFSGYAEQGLSMSTKGENIAAGQTSAAAAFASWQETNENYKGQGHRRNMLAENFTAVGIGHAVCNGTHYWVQEFGGSASSVTSTTADDSTKTVQVEVSQSKITKAIVEANPQDLNVICGSTVDLPRLNTAIQLADTWPGNPVPVEVPYAWELTDSQYASVSDGTLTGNKMGMTTLTANVTLDSEKTVTVPVRVTLIPQTITVAGSFTKTEGDGPFQLNASAETALTYSSNNENVATVASDGTVTLKGVGTATITITAASAGGYEQAIKEVTITVNEKKQPPASVTDKPGTSTNQGTPEQSDKKDTKSTASAAKPQKPKTVTVKKISSPKKGALKLTWKRDVKATGYQAMIATDKKFKKNKKTAVIKKNKTVTKTFTKLKRGKTYFAKVRAYKQAGKTKVYGAYSKVKKVKVR